MKRVLLFLVFIKTATLSLFAQGGRDSLFQLGAKTITLREVVVGKKLDVPHFIQKIQEDSSFYKAFKNLRILQFTAVNDIRMLGKKSRLEAMLRSKTRQVRKNNCRVTQVLEQEVFGDFFTADSAYRYYTADMYASLFFARKPVCGETNIVGDRSFSATGLKGMEKHKEQLKTLFFDPGRRISGIPFMSAKTEIYDDRLADRYHFEIGHEETLGQSCFRFTQTVRPGMEDRVVINEMTTWFNDTSYEVVARNWHLSFDAGVYDFDVRMEVQMTNFANLRVPNLIRYSGNWKALFKRRERGVFTATLSDFSLPD